MATLELNKAVIVTKSEAKATLQAAAKEGFNPIANGLGLPDGEYKFTTKATDYMGLLPVQSRKSGSKISLTFVLGAVEGRGDNEGVSKTFEDRNICVIPSNAWEQIEPSTEYIMTVNNNYVTSFELLNVDTSSGSTEISVDDAKAWLKANAGYKAKDLKDMSDAEVLEAYNDEQ